MAANFSIQSVRHSVEQRGEARFPVALPATAVVSEHSYSVRVLNVAVRGAMFELATLLPSRSRLIFRCGTISAEAVVAWQCDGKMGVKFCEELSDRDVQEQLFRSAAVAARRELKLSSPD